MTDETSDEPWVTAPPPSYALAKNKPENLMLYVHTVSRGGSLLFRTSGKPQVLYAIHSAKRYPWSLSQKPHLQVIDTNRHLIVGTLRFRTKTSSYRTLIMFPQTGHEVNLVSGSFLSKHGHGDVRDKILKWRNEERATNAAKSSSAFLVRITCRIEETGIMLGQVTMNGDMTSASIEVVHHCLVQSALDEIVVSAIAEMEQYRRVNWRSRK